MKRFMIFAGAAALSCGAYANLLSDGGFEIGDVYSPQFTGGPWTTEYLYATNINENSNDLGSIWHEGDMRVMSQANNSTTGHRLWDPVSANEGRYFLAVNGATIPENHPFVLEQVFSYTGSGPLTISFDSVNLYKQNSIGASTLTTYLDGVALGTTTTFLDNTWRTASYTASVGSGQTHTLKIVADSIQFSGNDFGLDNVSIQAVPEPFTTALSLAGAGLFIRRRMKAKKA